MLPGEASREPRPTRRSRQAKGREVGVGLVDYSASQVTKLKERHWGEVLTELHYPDQTQVGDAREGTGCLMM